MNATSKKIETASAILPRAELRPALALAKKIVERRNTIPILSHVLLRSNSDGGAEMVATDLDIELVVRINGASADQSFAVTLPAHTFQDIERKARATEAVAIDAPVIPAPPVDSLNMEDQAAKDERKAALAAISEAEAVPATLDFEGLRVTMHHLPSHDFPEMQWQGETKADFEIDTADFLHLIEATEFAISTEEIRHYLNGIYLHSTKGADGFTYLTSVATDGHRLAKSIALCGASGGMPGVIVPRKTVALLKSLCKAKDAPESVRIKINTTKALFVIGAVTVLSKMVDGTFPDYGRVILRGNDKRVRFDRKAMIEGVKAVACISSERGRAVKFTFEPGASHAVLTVNNPDSGTARINVACEFDADLSLDIGFNYSYVLDILDTCDGESVTMRLADAGTPALISGGNGGDEFVLMPMRV